MTTTDPDTVRAAPTSPHRRAPRAARAVAAAYLALALAGLMGTWYFHLQYGASGADQGYLQAWFANSASSSAAVDVIVAAVVACVFFLREGARLGWRWVPVALVPLPFFVALAFTFPLFLALRELRLARPQA